MITLSVIAAEKLNFQCSESNCILSNYTSLKIDGNYAMNFSPDIGQGDGILALKFESCEMYSIPNAIFVSLESILCVMASAPGFAALDEYSFYNAYSLQFLYLQQNRIERIEAGTFIRAANLNEINLAENQIRNVSRYAFLDLEHLESLSLSKNQLRFFERETFFPLKTLMNLDISDNMFEFLDADLFSENEKLNGLNVANNMILKITNHFMHRVPSLKVLNMMNNPCTEGTMLQNIPLIKILENRDINREDEYELGACFDTTETLESDNLDDLMSRAEEVEDDIEGLVITNLNEELREQDETIKKLQDETNHVAFLALISAGIAILVLFSKYARITVEKVYESQVKKLQETKAEAADATAPEKKDGCYVIEITKH